MHHILFIGAHPDDCDFKGGGTAALMARRGDAVKFVSVTNGDRGHFAPEYMADRSLLAARRREEGRKAAEALGATFETLEVHDGEVYVTPELTERMICLIRSWGPPARGPDLVLLNRPNDYHRDHRYTAQLVLDTTYVLTVPLMRPETPHLARMPVFAYWYDRFHEGGRFRPDLVVPIDDVMDVKIAAGMEHASQLYEWLPYNSGTLDRVPADEDGRRAYARRRFEGDGAAMREHCAPPGASYRFAEVFQISEYGRRPSAEELRDLFPVGKGIVSIP